jgi:hypothetical protein
MAIGSMALHLASHKGVGKSAASRYGSHNP